MLQLLPLVPLVPAPALQTLHQVLLLLLPMLGFAAFTLAFDLHAADLAPTPAGKLPDPAPFCFIFPQPGVSARCIVTDVYDGDTVTVELRIPIRVRLLDCWAPELRDAGGAEAKAALQRIAAGRHGLLWVPLADVHRLDDAFTFGRLLAHLQIDGADKTVSQLQVEAGHATTTKGGK